MTPSSQAGDPGAKSARVAVSLEVLPRAGGWFRTQSARRLGFGYALLAPAATPGPALLRLRAAADAALKNPALLEKFIQQGAEPAGGGAAALDELMRADLARWRKVVTDAGLKVD